MFPAKLLVSERLKRNVKQSAYSWPHRTWLVPGGSILAKSYQEVSLTLPFHRSHATSSRLSKTKMRLTLTMMSRTDRKLKRGITTKISDPDTNDARQVITFGWRSWRIDETSCWRKRFAGFAKSYEGCDVRLAGPDSPISDKFIRWAQIRLWLCHILILMTTLHLAFLTCRAQTRMSLVYLSHIFSNILEERKKSNSRKDLKPKSFDRPFSVLHRAWGIDNEPESNNIDLSTRDYRELRG